MNAVLVESLVIVSLCIFSNIQINNNSIRLLTITTDFIALWIFRFHYYFIFVGVESGDKCLLNPEALSCFSGVIMGIRSSIFKYLAQ